VRLRHGRGIKINRDCPCLRVIAVLQRAFENDIMTPTRRRWWRRVSCFSFL
jgi:hypothetical protein